MKYVRGDITKTNCNVICHGVNTLGVMGAGVALALNKKYPNLERSYQEYIVREELEYIPNRKSLLGQVHYFTNTADNKIICNLFIQNDVGRDGKKYGRYFAVSNGLYKIADYTQRCLLENTIAIPKIGCGFGGLDWNIVKEIMLEIEEHFNIEFEVYEL